MESVITPVDIFTLIPIAILVVILSYLSNKEIRKSLEQSKKTQALLQGKLNESVEALRKSREARLQELTKAAEFGRISQGLFHDLISPLTSLILHTESLKKDPDAHHNLEKALHASHRMAEYVKDVRKTLSKEEKECECNLKEELESVMHLLSYRMRDARVTLTKTVDGSISWFGYPHKIRQIFSNLLSNAIDSFEKNVHGQARKIHIELTRHNDTAKLEVSDTGSGISQENLEKIFEPFFTTKTLEKGTGIGLSTVKSIVEKDLKGKIEVESTPGKGSLFRITFLLQGRDPAASLRLQ